MTVMEAFFIGFGAGSVCVLLGLMIGSMLD